MIHVRIGKQLRNEMTELINGGLFSNQAELVREGIRRVVLEYYRQAALKNLPKQRGMLKGKGKGLTPAIRDKIAREMTPEKSQEILREFGFR